MKLYFALIGGLFLTSLSTFGAATQHLKLLVPQGYLAQVPTLVRVEIQNTAGERDWSVWNSEATLSADQPGVTLSTNRVRMLNGLGTVLVTFNNAGNFQLTASVLGLEASKPLRSLINEPATSTGGVLPAGSNYWSGVIRITNDVTVPAGSSLTIESNTWVVINGVSSGTVANDILVAGSIQTLGTEDAPVSITASASNLRWGQIRHNTAQPSTYRWTTITRAGRTSGEGHTGQGPVIRPTNSKVTFDHCSITDHAEANGTPGKIMYAQGSDLVFNNCVLARARMGPEIASSGVICTNSYLMQMYGPDDCDGFYVHTQGANQKALFSRCVVADGDDDGIDTLNASITVEHSIVRDWDNAAEGDTKGISAGFGGTVIVDHCLVVNCWDAISAKTSGTMQRVYVTRTTIRGLRRGIAAAWKSNATSPNIDYRITNCIVSAPTNFWTDFGNTNFTVGYVCMTNTIAGTGNIVADPSFVNAAAFDFRLQTNSPAIDSGDPSSPLDLDGSKIDMGYFTFVPGPPKLGASTAGVTLTAFPNRNYVLEGTTNFMEWSSLATRFQTNGTMTVLQTNASQVPYQFFRARLAP